MTKEEFEQRYRPVEISKVHLFILDKVFLPTDDPFIMNCLVRCGIDSPVIFSLLWGDKMACKDFPPELRKLVSDILQEEEKKKESYDLEEKKLHEIIIDLLQILYEREVYSVVDKAMR